MALSRRATTRMSANIWPGFVDAVTSLLMVMTFVLTIFIVVQYVLREEISGQQSELDSLSTEIAGLERSLGSSERRAAELARQRDSLSNESRAQSAQIAELETSIETQRDRIAETEAEVETLTAQRDAATTTAADLRAEQAALTRALASARDEIDARTEEARLAAARREALEALTARLRSETDDRDERIFALQADLTEGEKARAAEAAAAEELRRKLQDSEAELSALSLAMEEERRRAEETSHASRRRRRRECRSDRPPGRSPCGYGGDRRGAGLGGGTPRGGTRHERGAVERDGAESRKRSRRRGPLGSRLGAIWRTPGPNSTPPRRKSPACAQRRAARRKSATAWPSR